MRIAAGMATLEIAAPVMGRTDTVHLVLLWDDADVVLIDTGFPRQLEQLRTAAEAYGVSLDRLNRIVMTHQDIDHIGNLQDLVEGAATPIEVSAHELEKPYIQGEQRLLRFTDEAISSIDQIPPEVPEAFKRGLKQLMLHPPAAPVHRLIAGGQQLPWCGGLAVIDTPGHTPGHISLYHAPSRTLIAGDALIVRDGQLWGPDPATSLDQATAQAALTLLTNFDIATVVCYHGGIWQHNVNERIAELAAEAGRGRASI